MKHVLKLGIVLLLAVIQLECGGSKKISYERYAQMTAQERIAYLSQQVQKNPKDISLKKDLYQEYKTQGMDEQSIAVMEDIIDLDPNQTDILFEYAQLQYNMQNTKPAYNAFLSILQGPKANLYKSQISDYVAGKYLIQQLTQSPDDEAFPSFSQNGDKLIYQKKINNDWDIYEYDFKSQTESVLISTPADEGLPIYSVDQSKIYYTSTADDKRPIDDKFKVREIFVMDLKDKYVQNLTQTVADDWLPRSNQYGSQMLFVSERNDLRQVPYDQKHSDVFIMDVSGDFQRALTKTEANDGGACFSSHSDKIYFHSNRNGTYDIFVMDVNGQHVMTLIDNNYGDDVNPSVSPTSDEIVFFSNRDGNYDIYLAKTDGTSQQRLTVNPLGDFNPVFSPDGRNIAFHSERNGNLDIFLINLDSAVPVATTQGLIVRLNELIR
jgi:Tol biopolymer transport system component